MTKSFARRHPGKISLVLAILTGAGIPAAAADRILIFAGQSNMVGIGSANVPPSTADQAVIPNVQGFYTNSYCDGVGSSWDPGRTAPERFGEHSYISYEGGDYGNAARWRQRRTRPQSDNAPLVEHGSPINGGNQPGSEKIR